MADVSHELGTLRFVVESPLSSKVAMFNNQAQIHKNNQLLNPFSNESGRVSPKPQFSKDEYGKPLAGSLTEMRGQKANIHVMKEMLELCQIIDSEGYEVKDEPEMKVMPFGELFNIYNYISDKVVGILLRARKHKLVEFEGEILFQRRDDDVPVFLLKPIKDIRAELEDKMEEFKRASSPAPLATSVLLDKSANLRNLNSRTPSPAVSRSATPIIGGAAAQLKSPSPTQVLPIKVPAQRIDVKQEVVVPPAETQTPVTPVAAPTVKDTESKPNVEQTTTQEIAAAAVAVKANNVVAPPEITVDEPSKATVPQATEPAIATNDDSAAENKIDINNNNNNNNNDTTTATSEELPTVVIEATAVFVRNANPKETLVENNVAVAIEESANAVNSPANVNAENVATEKSVNAVNSPANVNPENDATEKSVNVANSPTDVNAENIATEKSANVANSPTDVNTENVTA